MDTYKIYKALERYFPEKTADRLANALVSIGISISASAVRRYAKINGMR